MRKRNITISLVAIIIVIIIFFIIDIKITTNTVQEENTITDKYDENIINKVKNEINAKANSNIYQVEEEYDGRKILQIRPNIQFETVLASILKNEKPLENEIQELLQKKPSKNGIWISEQSRDKFLNLLKENNIDCYSINNEGFLEYTGNSDKEEVKKINEVTTSNNLCIIDISGTSFSRDEISGEIVEYPFEKMEPYQAVDVYRNDNDIILEITTNEKGKLSSEEILKEVLSNFE